MWFIHAVCIQLFLYTCACFCPCSVGMYVYAYNSSLMCHVFLNLIRYRYIYARRVWKSMHTSYPNASAPDHWSRKPKMADRRIAIVFAKLQSNPKRPGGSKQGIRAKSDMNVIGVVLHINLIHIYKKISCNFLRNTILKYISTSYILIYFQCVYNQDSWNT